MLISSSAIISRFLFVFSFNVGISFSAQNGMEHVPSAGSKSTEQTEIQLDVLHCTSLSTEKRWLEERPIFGGYVKLPGSKLCHVFCCSVCCDIRLRYFDVLPWGYCSSYHSGVGSSFQ